jgi:MFS family permease
MSGKGIRNVFSNRNVMIVSMTNVTDTFFRMIYQPFWTLFLVDELNFSIGMVALLQTLNRSQNMLFSLPGGFLADRIGRRKVSLIAAFFRLINPIIYLTATSWEPIFISTIFMALGSMGTPAYDAMVAESLPRNQMATGYAVLNMARRAPGLVSAYIGGVLMDSMGIGPGTRLCFVGVLIGGIFTFALRYFFLTETLVRRPGRGRNIVVDFKELLPILKGSLRTMMVSSILYQVSAGLSSGLLVICTTDANSYPSADP